MKNRDLPPEPPPPDKTIRCPRLGHEIPFTYCRQENMGLPCFKILDCWHPYFQIVEFLRKQLSEEEWQQSFFRPAKPKILTLAELIDRARTGNRKQ